ncbi:UNVERIFIED_CONTAM: hypothetical protein ABIC26_000240 [Paenibacillus sp. PvR008]
MSKKVHLESVAQKCADDNAKPAADLKDLSMSGDPSGEVKIRI